jgi:hypothetical protein
MLDNINNILLDNSMLSEWCFISENMPPADNTT